MKRVGVPSRLIIFNQFIGPWEMLKKFKSIICKHIIQSSNSDSRGEIALRSQNATETYHYQCCHRPMSPHVGTRPQWVKVDGNEPTGYAWTYADPKHPGHMMTSSNGNIFRVTGHLRGEFTGPRWITRTKASDVELWYFLWSAVK